MDDNRKYARIVDASRLRNWAADNTAARRLYLIEARRAARRMRLRTATRFTRRALSAHRIAQRFTLDANMLDPIAPQRKTTGRTYLYTATVTATLVLALGLVYIHTTLY